MLNTCWSSVAYVIIAHCGPDRAVSLMCVCVRLLSVIFERSDL